MSVYVVMKYEDAIFDLVWCIKAKLGCTSEMVQILGDI